MRVMGRIVDAVHLISSASAPTSAFGIGVVVVAATASGKETPSLALVMISSSVS